MDNYFTGKFGKSSDSVIHPSFFGLASEYVSGVHRYTRLARDRTRAVYLVMHAPTKKIRGMILTTGTSTISCDANMLIQVLANEQL